MHGTTGPLARCTLADGQQVDVVVRRRFRTPAGTWAYEVELPLWTVVSVPGQPDRVEPEPAVFQVAPPHVEPIPGEDYGQLTRVRTNTPDPGWILASVRAGRPLYWLHRGCCWMVIPFRPFGMERLSTEQALDRMQDPAVMRCDVCLPDGVPSVTTGDDDWQPR